jgi:hypothetical protein
MRQHHRIGAALLALALAPGSPHAAAQGTLTIHQINVQQGDCTLIVGSDGTTFLIDAGNIGIGDGGCSAWRLPTREGLSWRERL